MNQVNQDYYHKFVEKLNFQDYLSLKEFDQINHNLIYGYNFKFINSPILEGISLNKHKNN